jgi:hypothetical protein
MFNFNKDYVYYISGNNDLDSYEFYQRKINRRIEKYGVYIDNKSIDYPMFEDLIGWNILKDFNAKIFYVSPKCNEIDYNILRILNINLMYIDSKIEIIHESYTLGDRHSSVVDTSNIKNGKINIVIMNSDDESSIWKVKNLCDNLYII